MAEEFGLINIWIIWWGLLSLFFGAIGMNSLYFGIIAENGSFDASNFEEIILPYINGVYPDFLRAIACFLAALFCLSIVMVSLRIVKR